MDPESLQKNPNIPFLFQVMPRRQIAPIQWARMRLKQPIQMLLRLRIESGIPRPRPGSDSKRESSRKCQLPRGYLTNGQTTFLYTCATYVDSKLTRGEFNPRDPLIVPLYGPIEECFSLRLSF